MMKKKFFRKQVDVKYKIIGLMLGLVISILLITFSFYYDNLFFTKGINNFFFSSFKSLNNKSDIVGENINQELVEEIKSLKDLLKIDNTLLDFEKINAVVISRNNIYWNDEVIINRGRNAGIEEGMAVVVSEGLVGRIVEVYDDSSRVKLITSVSYNETSVKINNQYLVLEFDIDGDLMVTQLDNTNSIKIGDVVYTSGLTDKFPKGITIGYVSSIENDIYGDKKKLLIKLFYDINDLRYVTVLKRLV